jgi:hypothetical protein
LTEKPPAEAGGVFTLPHPRLPRPSRRRVRDGMQPERLLQPAGHPLDRGSGRRQTRSASAPAHSPRTPRRLLAQAGEYARRQAGARRFRPQATGPAGASHRCGEEDGSRDDGAHGTISLLRLAGQGACYLAFVALIAFGTSATFTHFPPDRALIKLSFTHGAARPTDCRRLTAEEPAKLPPNMRRPVECARGRLPVFAELIVDGTTLLSASPPPTGLSHDGPSRIYRSFITTPGRHRLVLRLRDTPRTSGFDYSREAEIDLAPQQNFVIDFRPEGDGFIFR